MKLIASGASPYVRKVKVLLLESGQMEDVELAEVMTFPKATAPEAAAANPLGKVPALMRVDGPTIYDSRVICRFLDARAGGGFYPDARLWDVLTLEATADGILDAAVLMVYEVRQRSEDKQDPEWLAAQWAKIERAVAAINTRWMSHLAGPLDMGQIAVGCALSYLDFRQPDRDWRKGNEALADWHAEFAKRDSMIATAPQG